MMPGVNMTAGFPGPTNSQPIQKSQPQSQSTGKLDCTIEQLNFFF